MREEGREKKGTRGREGGSARERGRERALGRRKEGHARDGGARARKNERNLSISSFLASFSFFPFQTNAT